MVLTPPGFEPAQPPFRANLDDFVEDPDNQDGEISWSVPSLARAVMTVDEARNLTVSAPIGFVGFLRFFGTGTTAAAGRTAGIDLHHGALDRDACGADVDEPACRYEGTER